MDQEHRRVRIRRCFCYTINWSSYGMSDIFMCSVCVGLLHDGEFGGCVAVLFAQDRYNNGGQAKGVFPVEGSGLVHICRRG